MKCRYNLVTSPSLLSCFPHPPPPEVGVGWSGGGGVSILPGDSPLTIRVCDLRQEDPVSLVPNEFCHRPSLSQT